MPLEGLEDVQSASEVDCPPVVDQDGAVVRGVEGIVERHAFAREVVLESLERLALHHRVDLVRARVQFDAQVFFRVRVHVQDELQEFGEVVDLIRLDDEGVDDDDLPRPLQVVAKERPVGNAALVVQDMDVLRAELWRGCLLCGRRRLGRRRRVLALDLYVCLRPVRWFKGVPSPVKRPDLTDMVIFRENTEDIYAGIEWMNGTPEADKVKRFLLEEMGVKKIRFPETSSIGIKPVSQEGTERLVKAAIDYAIVNDRKSVTLVHKGNIQKFTEGAFRDWGYALARRDYGAQPIDKGPWCTFRNPKTGRDIVVKDCICDAFLQQILTRPAEYDVIATLNLNGDYVSDALAATVGGIGIAPGANINYQTGVAVFEATHGTAPKYAGLDKVNPGSLILSGEMMLRYMGWTEAADLVIAAMDKVIAAKTVTYDFARQMEGATEIRCSEFGAALAAAM